MAMMVFFLKNKMSLLILLRLNRASSILIKYILPLIIEPWNITKERKPFYKY